MNTDKKPKTRIGGSLNAAGSIRGNLRHLRQSLFSASGFIRVHPWLIISLAAVLAVSVLIAAPPPVTTASHAKGFRFPQYFEPPLATQMKSLLEAGEAD